MGTNGATASDQRWCRPTAIRHLGNCTKMDKLRRQVSDFNSRLCYPLMLRARFTNHSRESNTRSFSTMKWNTSGWETSAHKQCGDSGSSQFVRGHERGALKTTKATSCHQSDNTVHWYELMAVENTAAVDAKPYLNEVDATSASLAGCQVQAVFSAL